MQDVVREVGPGRVGRLGGAQASQAEDDAALERVPCDQLAQASDVVEIQEPSLSPAIRRRLHEVGRVALDQLLGHRPPERAAEHPVDVPALGWADAPVQRAQVPAIGQELGDAARAFDRFTRGDMARSSSGTGLGLAIVRTIAEAHGGRAEVVPGPGASVRIWLPDTVSGASQVADLASRSEETTPVRGGGGR